MAWNRYIEKILPPPTPPTPEQKSDIMSRLSYVGNENLSATQMKKLRRQATENFLGAASQRPNWPNRIEELWQKNGDKRFELK